MRAMIAAIAAPTVKTTQNNAMTENGIMAFTATSFPGRGAGGRGPDWRRGWLSGAVVAPGPLALPFADRHGAPDRFAAYPAVGGRHLPAGHVCADGGRRDIQVAGNVACGPPVTRQRLGHADQITALTLPDRGWRLRARSL